MGLIVGVHGIAQQLKAPPVLVAEWDPPLRGGIALAGGSLPEGALACAFYGDLFRRAAKVRASDAGHERLDDLEQEETALLEQVLEGARAAEPDRFPREGAAVRASTPDGVQAVLRLLTRSSFLTGIAPAAFVGNLRQVTRYLGDPDVRQAAQDAVDAAVSAETRVIVAHSLGTVVAYEAIATFAGTPRWANVKTLVTLGSPLGIAGIVFDKLIPSPLAGKGHWPPGIERWTNVSDDGDIVALRKALGPLFDGNLVDVGIDNEATAHDISPYLTARETGAAILAGLA